MFETERIDHLHNQILQLLHFEVLQKYAISLSKSLFPFTNKGSQLYWPYLIPCFILIIFSFLYYRDKNEKIGFKNFLTFVFPKKAYFHRSAFIDYQIFILNKLLFSLPKVIITKSLTIYVSVYIGGLIKYSFGTLPIAKIHWPLYYTLSLFLLLLTITSDFINYWFHRLSHTNAVLWPIHRVHHSAEVLNPFTLNRKHPLYDLLLGCISSTSGGILAAVFFSIFIGQPTILNMLGITLTRSIFNLFGAALRHTHIWIYYGPLFGRIFMSPAQHQIHHSKDKKHFNKNFAEIFAFWDYLFGTLYLPRKKEELEFGLAKEAGHLHSNILKVYFEPIYTSTHNFINFIKKPKKLHLGFALLKRKPDKNTIIKNGKKIPLTSNNH